MKKKIYLKTISTICMVTMISLSGFSQTLTYPIVETGQIISYDTTGVITMPTSGQAFYGQNSNHPGNIRSYTNNGDGTVTDNLTGLMWQQTEDRNNDGTIDFYDKLKYSEAVDSAATCKTGGYNDWRLPSIKELYSLAMFYGVEPGPPPSTCIKYIDTTYFSVGYGDVNSLSHGDLGTERIIDGQIASSTVLGLGFRAVAAGNLSKNCPGTKYILFYYSYILYFYCLKLSPCYRFGAIVYVYCTELSQIHNTNLLYN